MGQKVNPCGFRLSIRKDWSSSWYSGGPFYAKFIEKDYAVRKLIDNYYASGFIAKIVIERTNCSIVNNNIVSSLQIFIYSSNVGSIIGRNGKDLDIIKNNIKKIDMHANIKINVIEIKRPDLDATLIALNIANQLKRKANFKRVCKKILESSMRYDECLGIKISCAGRLGGVEIAKTERFMSGSVPLHTLNANIDYGTAESMTSYGVIGIKVWLNLEN